MFVPHCLVFVFFDDISKAVPTIFFTCHLNERYFYRGSCSHRRCVLLLHENKRYDIGSSITSTREELKRITLLHRVLRVKYTFNSHSYPDVFSTAEFRTAVRKTRSFKGCRQLQFLYLVAFCWKLFREVRKMHLKSKIFVFFSVKIKFGGLTDLHRRIK